MTEELLNPIISVNRLIEIELYEPAGDDTTILRPVALVDGCLIGEVLHEGGNLSHWLVIPVVNIFSVSYGTARLQKLADEMICAVPNEAHSWLEGSNSWLSILEAWRVSGEIITVRTTEWSFFGKVVAYDEIGMIMENYDRDDIIFGSKTWFSQGDIQTVKISEKDSRILTRVIASGMVEKL